MVAACTNECSVVHACGEGVTDKFKESLEVVSKVPRTDVRKVKCFERVPAAGSATHLLRSIVLAKF